MSNRMRAVAGTAQLDVPRPPDAAKFVVTAEATADMAMPSTCLMMLLTALRRARSMVMPAYTFRAISSSVTGTFWPHLDTDAMPAVPVGMFAYGYSAPGPTASTGRSVTNGSESSYSAAGDDGQRVLDDQLMYCCREHSQADPAP